VTILLLLIPLSLLLIGVAVWIFVWAVRRGQFEDLDTPAIDILRDDEHEIPRRDAPPRGSNDGRGDAG
jgi:cbb3-type cytochrome oxidase maturation protein